MAMGDQQKGLKRLRRASATFSLGSPSEILLVGYPSGVHYTWPSRAAGNPTGSSPYPLASSVPKFATPSRRPDKIRRRQRAPDSLGGLSLGHQFASGWIWECLQVLTRRPYSLARSQWASTISRVQIVISRSGLQDLGYRSVVLYAKMYHGIAHDTMAISSSSRLRSQAPA